MNPMVALSLSIRSKPGSYALLLGSGVSRAAQIPTGWEIVLDLVRQIARIEGEEIAEDPTVWYRQRFGAEPDYGILLGQIAHTQAERCQIIREYIEPSGQERDLGLKAPTDAHQAIAELVSDGYVRVVLTTNFDRLLESALADLGIVPAIIDSADAVKGTLPLVHNLCTIIKLHGDYADARILNTTDELRKYPSPINRLLQQILVEYGLIICGWSGEWDTALVEAIIRHNSPWFSTFWVSRGEPKIAARKLIGTRGAHLVSDMNSEEFFTQLLSNLKGLEDLSNPELVSASIARASVKRYIDDPSRRIRLHDLVVGEANRVRRAIEAEPDELYRAELSQEEIQSRLVQYERITETLRMLLATGCFWGESQHVEHWVTALERLDVSKRVLGSYYEDWLALTRYPAIISLYTAGIAAVARGHYQTLAAILERPTALEDPQGERIPFLVKNLISPLSEYAASQLKPGTIKRVVFYLYLWTNEHLWDPLREFVPDQDQFQACFDRFEYLAGLACTDMKLQRRFHAWSPVGMFAWRNHGYYGKEFVKSIDREIDQDGEDWLPLKAGMFGGSMDRLVAAKEVFDEIVVQVRFAY